MKTRIIILMLMVAILATFVGCRKHDKSPTEPATEMNPEAILTECMEIFSKEDCNYIYFYYYRDAYTDTVCVFAYRDSDPGEGGNLIPLRADGTPIFWSEIEGIKETGND